MSSPGDSTRSKVKPRPRRLEIVSPERANSVTEQPHLDDRDTAVIQTRLQAQKHQNALQLSEIQHFRNCTNRLDTEARQLRQRNAFLEAEFQRYCSRNFALNQEEICILRMEIQKWMDYAENHRAENQSLKATISNEQMSR
ncbi:MAG: hypothetical protein MMC23_009019 [Stictis urceolatum]|nr:hypothetical protein [Stictis urceolata]